MCAGKVMFYPPWQKDGRGREIYVRRIKRTLDQPKNRLLDKSQKKQQVSASHSFITKTHMNSHFFV